MQMRGVVIGVGALAVVVAQETSHTHAQARQPRLFAAHSVSYTGGTLTQATAKPAPKPGAGGGRAEPQGGRAGAAAAAGGSQTVKNMTAQQILDAQMAMPATPPPNPAAGRPIFDKQCAKCHKFGSLGNEVGPDLTTIKSRFKKKDILESVLWPSKVVSDQYHAVVIETKDGQSLTGIVVREDAARVLIKTAEETQKGIVIPKANITDRRVTDKSIMPEGLLKEHTQQEIANLVAFLLSTPPA
jgi:putative heme-binding domain-containing protein